jgi:PAS domain S-box-containing protein
MLDRKTAVPEKGGPRVAKALLHELSVQKVEMGLQNEELQRASLEAEEARQKYYDLYDRAPVAYVTLDRQGALIELNLAAARLLGEPRSALLGSPFAVFVRRHEIPVFTDFITRTFSSERMNTCEVSLVKKGIPVASVRIEGFQANSNPGEPPFCRAVLFDITERKLAEEDLRASELALRKANAELAVRVTARTGELTDLVQKLQEEIRRRVKSEAELTAIHEQLEIRAVQLRELAGEITRAEQRERLRLATVLHDDLQQLLVAAKLQLSLLSRGQGKSVREGAAGILGILEQCLATTRSLTSDLHPAVLSLEGVPEAINWVARWMTEKHGLRVDARVEGEIPPLAEDLKVLLFEAVRELLFNVVKHAGVDSAEVHLQCTAGSSIEVTVSDTGTGFDPAQLLNAGAGGTGFGLFGVRERMALVEGTLEIKSAPGKGSRFTLTVPIGHPPPVILAPADGEAKPASKEPLKGPVIRILLADDHSVIRVGLTRLLSQEPDLEVVGQAVDGKEVVEMADRHRPDVILMDVRMPGLDGIHASRVIHAAHPEIRIIALTMYDEIEHRRAMLAAGAVAFVSKSGASSELLATIRSCASRPT